MIQPLTAAVPVPAVRPARPGSVRWKWALLLAAGWLAQTALRLWLTHGQTLPLTAPDEPAFLIAARVMAGGVPDNFSHSPLYPSGYPLLVTPLFWFAHFAHNPVAAYRAVLTVNAPISALMLPLAYLAGRRLGLRRQVAYSMATVTALLPAALFCTEYAMTDAIYPVLVLAWLLATHTWLTGRTPRSGYLAAVGSGLLAGYLYGVDARGLVIVAGYLIVGVLAWRRYLVPRGTLLVAAGGLLVSAVPCWLLNRYLTSRLYPSGALSLAGAARLRLDRAHGVIRVLELASGQLGRFVLGGWGVAAIGLGAACYVIARGSLTWDLRVMAGLTASITLVIAFAGPAALPPDQWPAWAGGRYLDAMVTVLFIPGCVALSRLDQRLGFIMGALAIVGAVSLTAAAELTSQVSRARESAAADGTAGFVSSTGLRPGERLAVGTGVAPAGWMPQAYQVWWAPLEFFDPATQQPPASASVVELAWPAGQPAQASWLTAPDGWHIVATDGAQGWVAWRHAGSRFPSLAGPGGL